MPTHPAPRGAAQRGFILVTGLLFLVVMTLIALAMFRSTGLMQRISANARDKQRSFEAAQSALQYAEWWLSTNTPAAATACTSGLVSGDTVSNIHVCSNTLDSTYLSADWTNAFTYTPPNVQVTSTGSTAGGQVTTTDTSSDAIYWKLPGFFIEYVGVNTNKGGKVYRVTAYGYGGDTNTRSVVRSTYRLPSTTSGSGGSNGLGGP
ncbi:MAG: pilus assembly protein [Pseudomonadota bacterium]|nr:pilus assembly protein [Pseudomonadota bacterium]